ncbi:hypothetical protein [Desulfospira joergensenii]|uniref:hypothetical protein n=1 Tax=Desulfospira joergensenii TaxID=53329 RepID=UPI0003B3AC9A|nr:hypothetical protein [Desulfospira joergensenii]
MTEPAMDEQVAQIFKNSAKYVEDILRGKTTIAKAAKVPPENVEKCFTQARNALMMEDFPRAEELFTVLLALSNQDVRVLLGLGGALEGQEKFEYASAIYSLVIAMALFDPVAPFRAGICMMRLGKKEEAVKLFDLAADCEDTVKDPKKLVYVQKAKGMLKVLRNA